MSNNNQTLNAATATPGDGTTAPPAIPSPTMTRYQQVADNFAKALDEVIQLIPDLQIVHVSKTNFVRSHANLPIPFLATAVVAVDDRPELNVLDKLDVNVGRNKLQFLDAFRPMSDKVRTFSANLDFTVASVRADLGASALQVYWIAKGIARSPEGAAVAAHVANMKRDLGRRGPKPSPKPGPVTTAIQEAKAA